MKTHQNLRVAIYEWNRKLADELARYLKINYYADVELVDGSVGEKKAVEEMRKFKPNVFIVAQVCNPLLEYAASGGIFMVEVQRHIDICREILGYEKRPFLIALCESDLSPKMLQRFSGRCREWGYDAVVKRGDVNSYVIAFWFRRARELYGG